MASTRKTERQASKPRKAEPKQAKRPNDKTAPADRQLAAQKAARADSKKLSKEAPQSNAAHAEPFPKHDTESFDDTPPAENGDGSFGMGGFGSQGKSDPQPFPFNGTSFSSSPSDSLQVEDDDKTPFKGMFFGVKVDSESTSSAKRLQTALQNMVGTPTGKQVVDWLRDNNQIIHVGSEMPEFGNGEGPVVGGHSRIDGIGVYTGLTVMEFEELVSHETSHKMTGDPDYSASAIWPGNQPPRQEFIDTALGKETSAFVKAIDVVTELNRTGFPFNAQQEAYVQAYRAGVTDLLGKNPNATQAEQTQVGRQAGWNATLKYIDEEYPYREHYGRAYSAIDEFNTALQDLGERLPPAGGILGLFNSRPNATNLADLLPKLERTSENTKSSTRSSQKSGSGNSRSNSSKAHAQETSGNVTSVNDVNEFMTIKSVVGPDGEPVSEPKSGWWPFGED